MYGGFFLPLTKSALVNVQQEVDDCSKAKILGLE
jgi:hypothetical protein